MAEMTTHELHSTVKEFQKILDTANVNSSEIKEKLAKMEADFDKYEQKNQELTKVFMDKKEADLKIKELGDKLELLEKQASRVGLGGKAEVETKIAEAKKAMDTFFRKGDRVQGDDLALQQKYLRTDSDVDGGYLAPFEYQMEIVKKITEISPIREVARTINTTRESLHVPLRQTIPQGNWVGEGNNMNESESTYGMAIIKAQALTVNSKVTVEMLQDGVFNIEELIASDIAESFAQSEGRAFVLGDGINRPQGILSSPDVQLINSGIANSYDSDSLINMVGQLKVGYNPTWLLNRREVAFVRRLKDGIGQYLWTPGADRGLTDGYPAMIAGHPYREAIDVPDQDVNATPVIFGDFMRGYWIVDRRGLTLVRDPFTQGNRNIVNFYATRRVGGLVVLPEAIKVLKCST